jgi:beta-fructofuranosidase
MSRPRLHFTARSGWINDPIGLTYHDGLYHLFFQYVAEQTVWGPACGWGHAVSPDLLSWSEREPVLLPGDGDEGCWSGCLVRDDRGAATIFYTSVQLDDLAIGRLRTATPLDPTWDTWRKGPVLDVDPPEGATIFRDPQISHDGDRWRMLVGSGRPDHTATALGYSSADLVSWTAHGEFASRSGADREGLWTGTAWECPQLIRLGDRHVLLFSVWEPWIGYHEAYAVGRVVGEQLDVESWGRLTYGEAYYAGATFADADGSPGLVHWLRGVDDVEGQWAGAHSVPHQVHLDRHGVLVAEPHPNLGRRRGPHRSVGSGSPGATALPEAADVEWRPDPGGTLRITAAGGLLLAELRVVGDELHLAVGEQEWSMPGGPQLRLVVDGPVLEVFGTAGVFAAALPAAGPRALVLSDGHGTVHELRPT